MYIDSASGFNDVFGITAPIVKWCNKDYDEGQTDHGFCQKTKDATITITFFSSIIMSGY